MKKSGSVNNIFSIISNYSSSDQTKRKITAQLRKENTVEELAYSAQMKLRAEGQPKAADIIKKYIFLSRM